MTISFVAWLAFIGIGVFGSLVAFAGLVVAFIKEWQSGRLW